MAKRRPVRDLKLASGMTADQLVRQLKESGGFTSRKLSDAVDVIESMERHECTKFLSFPACIMATGTRGVIVEMVKRKLVDVDHHHLRDFGPRFGKDMEVLLSRRFLYG